MFVRHWMSRPAVTRPADTPAADALELMWVQGIRRLPVTENDQLAGIVTREHLQLELGRDERSLRRARLTLGDVMTRGVATAGPDDTLETAAQLMLDRRISGLPVLLDGRIEGIITESDIFRAFTRIMGLAERGARLVMTIPGSTDLLEGIRRRLGSLAPRSLAAYQTAGGDWEVTARVAGRDTSRRTLPALNPGSTEH